MDLVQKKRLELVAEKLPTVPFNWKWWETACRTTHCVAGWLPTWFPEWELREIPFPVPAWDLPPDESSGRYPSLVSRTDEYNQDEFGQLIILDFSQFFGITNDEARAIMYPDFQYLIGLPRSASTTNANDVVKIIRYVIQCYYPEER